MSKWISLALTLAFSAPAWATEGLAWQWPDGEVRRYRVKASLQLPLATIFMAENNIQARVFDVDMAMDVSCSKELLKGSSLEVLCDVDGTQWIATAEAQDAGRLPRILDEWDQKLVDDAKVRLTMTTDGKLKTVDLEGLNERMQRIRLVKETMHSFITRAFSVFDLELPKKGDDGGEPWKQRSPMVAQLPILTGMSGNIQADSHVAAMEGTVATIDTTGRASLMVQPLVDGGTIQPDVYDMNIRSRSTFDTATGNLLSRSCLAEGKMTPGSGNAQGRADAPYVQAVELIYIAPGAPMDNLGPNKEKLLE